MSGVIVVDAESFRSTCFGRDGYIHDHRLDILITMLNSVNCSTIICSPTIEYLCSREKPLVKPMAPGSVSYYIASILFTSHLILLFCNLYFLFHIPKILLYHLSSLSDLMLQITVKGLTTPYRIGCKVGVCLCRYSVT